ncbi:MULTISPECIES: hypothetical protein [unclassified Microcoleus]|uniref:hypothetical protein n=1 Tax=unclassified Microcoleus TaxID=2642155 RepID=UPI0025D1BE1C|nr:MULTISPECIES: hypothetical protein [unclassified Microcoleus]
MLNANSRAIAIVVLVLSAVECKCQPNYSIDKSSALLNQGMNAPGMGISSNFK